MKTADPVTPDCQAASDAAEAVAKMPQRKRATSSCSTSPGAAIGQR
jgi:hypothetical protein